MRKYQAITTAAVALAALFAGGKSLRDPGSFKHYFRMLSSAPVDCKSPLESPVTFDKVQARVSECGLKTVEETLAILPEAYRSSFTLMRKSKSAQEASGDNPRVILYGSDAKLIMTFNGDESQKGYNEIEAIQFNDQTKQFDFHQIGFSAKHQSPATIDADIQSCTTCHRTPARPNWEAYDIWEGAYGQVEDQIKIGSAEDTAFQRFIKLSRNKGRYKYLVGSQNLSAPSIAEVANEQTAEQAHAYSIIGLPNFSLTLFLNLLNYQRLANEIRKTPDFETYKYAYYGALFGCGPMEDFIPKEVLAKFSSTYAQVFQDTIQDFSNQYAKRMQEDGPFDEFTVFNQDKGPANFEATSASRFIIVKLRYLTEGRGISIADWSLAPNPKAYIFSDGELYLKEIARSFEPELKQIAGLKLDYVTLDEDQMPTLFGSHAQDFAGLKRLSCCNYDANGPRPPGPGDDNCSILKNLSVQAFQGQGTFVPAPVNSAPPPQQGFHRPPEELFNTCIGCHGTNNGSKLVFKDLASLQALLSRTGYASGTLKDEIQFRLTTTGDKKMPPYDGLMSDDERAKLATYLTTKE